MREGMVTFHKSATFKYRDGSGGLSFSAERNKDYMSILLGTCEKKVNPSENDIMNKVLDIGYIKADDLEDLIGREAAVSIYEMICEKYK